MYYQNRFTTVKVLERRHRDIF